MTIFPTPAENGKWILTDAAGREMQDGYKYDSPKAALEAAAQLWPANSIWHGRRVRNGWRIVDPDDDGQEEPRRPKAPGTRPDTSLFLGDDRKAWLQAQGGIQPTIQRLIDEAMNEQP